MFETLIWCGIFGLVSTALLHSFGGEHFLLRPMFRHRGNRVLESELARLILRFAWHITSIAWLVLASILYAYAFDPDNLGSAILVSIGGSFAAIGLFDLIITKGRHIGWPFLLLTGLVIMGAWWIG